MGLNILILTLIIGLVISVILNMFLYSQLKRNGNNTARFPGITNPLSIIVWLLFITYVLLILLSFVGMLQQL